MAKQSTKKSGKPPVLLVLATGPRATPTAVTTVPEGYRATAHGEAILRWYKELLNTIGAQSSAWGPGGFPVESESSKGALSVRLDSGEELHFPVASLVIWRAAQIEAAVGAENVWSIAEHGAAKLRVRDPGTADLDGRHFDQSDSGIFDCGEQEYVLLDGSQAPYIGFTHYAGQLLVAASPDVPRLPDPSGELLLPDLRVFNLPPSRWTELCTAGVRRRSGEPEALPDQLKFPADRIHLTTIEAFSKVEQWSEGDGFHRAHTTTSHKKDFAMMCGFRTNPGPQMWEFLLGRGEAAIKAHYALLARLYEQTGARPGEWAVMNINQFCSDLGYAKATNGGFKRERKQEAMQLLELLTTVEIAVQFTPPGPKAKTRRVRGALWTRGLVAEEQDSYTDLLGAAREGDPSLWDPAGFTFGPGPWFSDPEWRKNNRYLGLIGSGLMKLRTDTDQTAIRIGGYLGSMGRFEQYRPRRVRIETLLQRIGMAGKYPRDPAKLQEKIEGAFNKLVEVGVVARWEYTDAEPDEPDMDDPKALAVLADHREISWRRRTVEVEWPESLLVETKRLEEAQRKALQAEARRVSEIQKRRVKGSN